MSKEMKNILIAIITLAINVLAPILMIDMYNDYTAKSFVIGTPDKVVKIENLDINNYIFQENLSTMNFVEAENENEYIFNYYFGAKDFNSTENNYLIYINDYMLSITNIEARAISGCHTRYFRDSNGEVCNEVDIEVTFEFYSTYSYLLMKLTTPDITYFNGFRENPGLVLTLSKVDYGMLGNLDNYKEVVTLQQELTELQERYNTLQSQYTDLQNQYNQSNLNNEELSTQISTLNGQIAELQARLDAYDKQGKYEVTFQSSGITQEVALVESSVGALTTEQVPTLEHTQVAHFVGWSIDGATIVDPTTINITSNTTFVAVWTTIKGTWNFTATGYLSQYAASGEFFITSNGISDTSSCLTGYSLADSGDYYFIYQCSSKDYLDIIYLADSDTIVVYGSEMGVDGFEYDDVTIVGTATRIS